MIAVKVTTADGNNWSTEINCTFEQATEYYMGKVFTDRNDQPMQPVVSVQLLT